ncbi:MAG: hypothetical protein LUD72_07200 [Bacteroidales bacterium]|nr:hypothetical protein [Bacteroidales bacterium]
MGGNEMNWLWIFLTVLIGVAVAIVIFIIGLIIGFEVQENRMNDNLKELADEYRKALKENTDFFKQMADAINEINKR